MKNILVKVLMALTLILLAMTVYNHSKLSEKNHQIEVLLDKQSQLTEQVEKVNDALTLATKAINEADQSYVRLTGRINQLEANKHKYAVEIQGLKNDNEKIKEVLDTRLPDELVCLLNEAIGEPCP